MINVLTSIVRYTHPKSAVKFWHTKIAAVFYKYDSLENYYIDLSEKIYYRGPYDQQGIPLLNYFGEVGVQYNPCAISQWGLGAYQCWKSGQEKNKKKFFEAAEWLVDNIHVNSDGAGFWHYEFDFYAYNLRKPWFSALAQAQGISLLLRAYKESGNNEFMLVAEQACKAMLKPVSEGGLLLRHNGNVFLEEVVADRPTAILDGLIFAIFGLNDYCIVKKNDHHAAQVLRECIDTIARLLPDYDLGYWSRADLYAEHPPMPSSRFYHTLHIAQLRVLADITKNKIFDDYSNRWQSMLMSRSMRNKALAKKIVFKMTKY